MEERPFILLLKKEVPLQPRKATDWPCRYRIDYATVERRYVREGTVINQYYDHYPFFMELVEVRVKKDVEMSFQVTHRGLFLFIVLEGHVDVSLPDRDYTAISGCGYTAYSQPEIYPARIRKGVLRYLYIAPRKGWMEKHRKHYPYLSVFIGEFLNGQQVGFMPQISLTDGIRYALREIYRLKKNPLRALEAGITYRCMQLLDEYHAVLKSAVNTSLAEKVENIAAYLDSHYADPDIDRLSFLSERFHFSERTLPRVFLDIKGATVRGYVEKLRLEHAMLLLRETGIPINEIARRVGFKYANHFAGIFRRYFGVSPRQARRP